MRRFLRGLLFALLAYPLAGVAGAAAVTYISANRHDRAVEAVMTGAFVIGPLGAVVAFVVGWRWRPRSRAAQHPDIRREP